MFEKVIHGLAQLDRVLNEEELKCYNTSDLELGFSSSSVDLSGFTGIEALKKRRDESKYILLKLSLSNGEESFSTTYLRGFERYSMSHPPIMQKFLTEMRSSLPGFIKPMSERYSVLSNIYLKDINLSIGVLGGGMYKFRDRQLVLSGFSTIFGPIYPKDREIVDELLDLLVQKESYRDLL